MGKPNNSPEITAKKREEGKDLGGRPRFQIDYETLAKLCHIQCTGEECAEVMRCSYDTLDRRLKQDYADRLEAMPDDVDEGDWMFDYGNGFKDYFSRKSKTGNAALRRKQFNMANEGNVQLLKWLGINNLGQTNRVDHTTQGGSIRPPSTVRRIIVDPRRGDTLPTDDQDTDGNSDES